MNNDYSDSEIEELTLIQNYREEGWEVEDRKMLKIEAERYVDLLRKRQWILYARVIDICKPIIVYLSKNRLGIENQFNK